MACMIIGLIEIFCAENTNIINITTCHIYRHTGNTFNTNFHSDEDATAGLLSFLKHRKYVRVLISLWLFLFAAQPKEFFSDGLKKLKQGSHKCVELRGKICKYIFSIL
jgi:hypothetical protein